ncbi:COX15/CtaA family protein [Parvibaculaceae bacterium PLY_AMNH_Bact1]|nr:COX15/CtaA family protein [Parvibaculaceae bacterium PLY_AMNH_Bact1]
MTATDIQTSAETTDRQVAARRSIAIWLFVICGLVAGMVVVGGATRLTDSGLSITEWKPVTGAIPPLSQEVWEEEFEKYKQIPEYIRINRGMSLDEFKTIYWWEWGHRLLGRLVGLAFLVPFVYFYFTKRIERPLLPHLAAMFVLGGLQGALGWYMVMSGLTERVDVSQYRLAAHLSLAFFVYGYMFWFVTALWRCELPKPISFKGIELGAAIVVIAIFIQVILGAFVAGLNAGFIFNTWPLMDGAFIPRHLYPLDSIWASAFDDVRTVQFNHRMFAYALLVLVGWHYWNLNHAEPAIQKTGHWLLAALLAQVFLGIATILTVTRVEVALLHQAGAVLLLSVALFHLQTIGRATR